MCTKKLTEFVLLFRRGPKTKHIRFGTFEQVATQLLPGPDEPLKIQGPVCDEVLHYFAAD